MWIKLLAITLVPVGGCMTGYTRDTEETVWPPAYRHPYYVVGWKEKVTVEVKHAYRGNRAGLPPSGHKE